MRRIYGFACVVCAALTEAGTEANGGNAAGATALEAAVAAKKPRNPSVSAADFVAAVKAGSLAEPKLTGAQVAKSLGMNQASFEQRLNQLRKEWAAGVKAGDFKGDFPFTLLDGRTLRQGTGKGVKTRNAIFAALTSVDSDTEVESTESPVGE